jgi:hypothetical protein
LRHTTPWPSAASPPVHLPSGFSTASRFQPLWISSPAKFDTLHKMNYVKITTEHVVGKEDAEGVMLLMNDAMDRIAALQVAYDSLVATMNTTEPENFAEIARP